ncbi:MAG: sucrose phosphorylase [Candidatus Methanocomedens sp.]|nr:MAG: sucrose phosphorylase [ANME-2 cluster archaeon]
MGANHMIDEPKTKIYDTTKTLHNPEPDYTKSILKIPEESLERMHNRLRFLYSESVARTTILELERILQVYYAHKPQEQIEKEKNFDPAKRFTQKDVILITYGDLLQGKESSPLATLARFCDTYLKGTINTLHLLPFFPSSSDKGFSIIDFETVDPNLGSWHDIEDLENRYQLMFDSVINHVSSKAKWFSEFLNNNPYYKDFFFTFKSREELTTEQRSLIFRPRTSKVLTEFQSLKGAVYVWTTFSPDQIDLNFKNPNVLLRIIETLLLYVRHGADIIRLDAVMYLWEEPGTKCVHLEQTHEIIKLLRDILNAVAPRVALITETNVAHDENIVYFGNGQDEAQMVYNFALPPLVLHSFYTENTTILSTWAKSLIKISDSATYFNFLDSHDGIGLMAVRDILGKEDIDYIIEMAKKHGGYISYKTAEDGNAVPYEINITWYSALNPVGSDEDIHLQVKRFIASRSIAFVIRGVPGIYLHSLFGTRGDQEAVKETQDKRAINRTIVDVDSIIESMNNPSSKKSLINRDLGRLIGIRINKRAFHPNGDQQILMISQSVFAVLRTSPEMDQHILAITNVTGRECRIEIPMSDIGLSESRWYDLINRKARSAENQKLCITLQPYDVIWLQPSSELVLSNPETD